MKNFYALGPVYIWIKTNNVNRLGTECIVTGNIKEWTCVDTGKRFFGQQTDSEQDNGFPVCAVEGSLRTKNPPSGEKSISEMFSNPYMKELDKEKELEEAYE